MVILLSGILFLYFKRQAAFERTMQRQMFEMRPLPCTPERTVSPQTVAYECISESVHLNVRAPIPTPRQNLAEPEAVYVNVPNNREKQNA